MFVIGSNSASTGYNLTRSLRTRASATAYFSRTPATTTNQQIWTWSAWVKRGGLAAYGTLLNGYSSGANQAAILFWIDDTLSFNVTIASVNYALNTTQVFRDPSAWYHIVYAVDTTQATAANRVKLYVNGTQVTAFSGSYPPQNSNLFVNSTNVHNMGRNAGGGNNFDGYLAEVNLVDGQALTPSSFGSTNALTGVWQPAAYTGSYGTNGVILDFEDNSALTTSSNVGLGKDTSGNGNYWTTNNISITAGVTYDSMTDVPTLTSATAANFCVLNPVDKDSDITMSNGNLTATAATGVHNNARSTMGCGTTGYWYMEFTYTSSISGGNAIAVGLYDPAFRIDNGTHPVTSGSGFYGLYGSLTSNMYTNGTTPSVTVSTGSVGNILQFAYDVAGGKLWYGLNNVWYDSSGGTTGNPSTGSNATITTVATNRIFGLDIVSNTINFNFGQRPFTYTAPTGFVALNTYNLPTSTIVKGNTVMDATTYTGTGASLSVTNTASFKPDLVWVKGRSGATDHAWYDSVRGTTKQIESNNTGAETTEATGLTAFGSAGFTVGALAQMNTSAATYVGWQWQAGQGTSSSNTSGTITSTVSVNASAGFSVVTWTGTGANATVGHGLGVAPQLIINKPRNAADNWISWHTSLGSTGYIYLNLTNASATGATVWNSTLPTSSVFSVGTSSNINTSAQTMVSYCWTPIAGYSAFGSYTGNGSTDGPMVYTGFRPKFVMIKVTSTAQPWIIIDTARNTYNVAGDYLMADSSSAENALSPISTATALDILSNGFKLRNNASSSGYTNASSATYIYMAFAENPLKNALAR